MPSFHYNKDQIYILYEFGKEKGMSQMKEV